MSSTIYACCKENRKAALLGNPTRNGIDYLEVLDHDAIPLNSPRQRTLLIHCLNPLPTNLGKGNVIIGGGESITGIVIQWIAQASAPPPQATAQEAAYFSGLPDRDKVLVVRTNETGDFSPYTLRLVNDAAQASEDSFEITESLTGFDPLLSEVEFSFKVECGPDFDCAPVSPDCPPDLPPPPPINYLAKDYGSFRSILLDRLNQLVPNWGASTEADQGVVLAELVAYVGDYLSYQQDAVATEAYLETARSRISLRRHTLLVDYTIHDGCNARTFVHLEVNAQAFLDSTLARFYTFAPGMPPTLAVGAGNEEAALLAGVVVFEPMQDAVLHPEHNRIDFYTWGDLNCCLPASATEATLLGSLPHLQPGDVLVFQEVIGPLTGNPADADIRHRCAVRLTQVTIQNSQGQPLVDPLFTVEGAPIDSASQTPTLVTEIQWSSEDALPFALCLSSSFLDSAGRQQTLINVSIALGNNVLADQGLSLNAISIGVVPQPSIFFPPGTLPSATGSDPRCDPSQPVALPVRYRPLIPDSPLTQAVPLPVAGSPVTPGIVPLVSNGFVHLADANGFTSLSVQAVNPWIWPQYFGVSSSPNAIHPGNFDLTLVYNPPGGPSGVPGPVILENFSNLSLTVADPNYAPRQLNSLSKFLRVPASFVPPGISPAAFPANPIQLPNSGDIDLVDSGGNPYLTVHAATPTAWPPTFGVLVQGNQADPDIFNLLVVYNPSAGGVGVPVPVLVEQFNNVTLENVAAAFASDSELIRVRSFSQEPNPSLSAFALTHFNAEQARPEIRLSGLYDGSATTWTAKPDLLESGSADPNFVVEIEFGGSARIRFGDNTNGLFPESTTAFTASYRIGNGTAGNIGAETLTHLATGDARIRSCINPLPASGGVDPETADQIRRRTSQAFLTQQRAITMPDYVAIAERNTQIDQAVATLRWTGSWYTVFIAAEPKGGGNLTPALRKALTRNINRYRLAGQDIQLQSPQYLPLKIELTVCVDPAYFQADVRKALLEVLGSRLLPNGQKGLFYPDTFTFGRAVYLSPIYVAARKIAGITSVTATRFEPQGAPSTRFLAQGKIPLGPFQITQMENDRNFPNHGQLTLVLKGGK
jgi:hypothetical protein